MEHTAVEWLAKNLKDFPHIKHSFSFKELIKQAKEMEKEQIKDAYIIGRTGGTIKDFNETFKSE
jgi:hypothetical protein